MKNKIMYVFCIITLASLGFAEDINKENLMVNINTSIESPLGNINSVSPTDKELDAYNLHSPENTSKPNFSFEVDNASVKDTSSLGQKFDFNKLIDDIDNYWEVFDSGSEKFFKTVSDVSDSVTAASSIAGSFFGFGGIAVVGNNVQQVMQKILLMKNRVDQLKQYKRFIESVKGLGKNDLKTLAGIKGELEALDRLVKDGFELKDSTIKWADSVKNVDLSTTDGWNKLLVGDENIRKLNDNVLNQVNGDKAKQVLKTISDMKENLKTINPKNENQNLQYLNQQIAILISLMEKHITDSSLVTSSKIIAENKKVEEEIAAKKLKQTEIEALKTEINNINSKVENIELGKSFIGSVNGNR